MTPTKYFLARVGLAFGIQRRNQRMADAAAESHLLRDAELHLGLAVWEQCDGIEEISVEYWNNRKLVKEMNGLSERLAECQARLDEAHEQRASLLLAHAEQDPEITEKRVALIQDLDALAAKRDVIIANARRVRRVYDGLKMKLEVMKEATDPPAPREEIEECVKKLRAAKDEFAGYKDQRAEIGAEIEAKDEELAEMDRLLDGQKKERRVDASQAFQVIGECNKEVSALRAEIGLLEKRHLELCAEIGRHISRNAHTNQTCAAICKNQMGLIEIMAAMRRSIAYNRRLAGL
jgi:uncharacterized coiled-coil DUF342 family protein